MTSIIKDEQVDHFKYLSQCTDDTLIEVCKLALEYLKEGPKPDKYSINNKDPDFIKAIIESLVFFLLECLRLQVSNLTSLTTSGFSETKIEILQQFVQKERQVVHKLLTADHSTPHFRDLEWRLETRVASRALHEQMTPLVTVKLHLDSETVNENKDKLLHTTRPSPSCPAHQQQVIMQMDPGTLRGIIVSLDEAIQESKTHRTRLFTRAFQR